MKDRFKKAFRIFKSLSIIFSIAYWIYIVIDDYQFIENTGPRTGLNTLESGQFIFLFTFLNLHFVFGS